MTDLLQTGAAWLAGVLQENAGQPIVYSRGADFVGITATLGKSEWETSDESGVTERFESRDFLFPAADLVLGGAVVEPAEGDTIAWTTSGTTYTFSVLAPAGQDLFRYTDPTRVGLRVHTKLTATAAA